MSFTSYNDLATLFRSKFSSTFLKDNLIPARNAKLEAVDTIYKALAGNLPPAYYLCSLGVGGGKSTLIKDVIRCHKAVGFKPDGGIIVCLQTLKEVEEFASTCGLSTEEYAVFTGKQSLNRYGRQR